MRGPGSVHFGVVVLAFVCANRAQPQVLVSGKVIDENGVAVAGARVELQSSPSTSAVAATSDKAGGFNVDLERPGQYSVRAERQGFFLLKNSTATLAEGPNHLVI